MGPFTESEIIYSRDSEFNSFPYIGTCLANFGGNCLTLVGFVWRFQLDMTSGTRQDEIWFNDKNGDSIRGGYSISPPNLIS